MKAERAKNTTNKVLITSIRGQRNFFEDSLLLLIIIIITIIYDWLLTIYTNRCSIDLKAFCVATRFWM